MFYVRDEKEFIICDYWKYILFVKCKTRKQDAFCKNISFAP